MLWDLKTAESINSEFYCPCGVCCAKVVISKHSLVNSFSAAVERSLLAVIYTEHTGRPTHVFNFRIPLDHMLLAAGIYDQSITRTANCNLRCLLWSSSSCMHFMHKGKRRVLHVGYLLQKAPLLLLLLSVLKLPPSVRRR